MNLESSTITARFKTICLIVSAIITFTFSIAVAYSSIQKNSEAIANQGYEIKEMKREVAKIPVLETKIQFLVGGMEKLTNTKYNE